MPHTPTASDANRAIGIRIRLRRTELGMTQDELAGRIGVAQQQVVRYEAGTLQARGSRLLAIARALDVPVAYFLDQSSETMEAASGTLATTRGAMALLRAYAAIEKPRQRAALVGLAWAFVEQARAQEDAANAQQGAPD